VDLNGHNDECSAIHMSALLDFPLREKGRCNVRISPRGPKGAHH